VWLLPGITLTIGILEIFSRMIVYGSARLIYGISIAMQIGFGLTIGYKLVFGPRFIVESFSNGCRVGVDPRWFLLLTPAMATATAICIQCQRIQIPGMIFTSVVAESTSYFLQADAGVFGPEGVPLLSALAVTLAARLYSGWVNERPFCYIVSGLLILVPGGVGVKGSCSFDSTNMSYV
jgi:uncharacterized membrane protein YjjB (DUF3815 family)